MLDEPAARPIVLGLSTISTAVPAPCDDLPDLIVLPEHINDPDPFESVELRNARAVEMEIKRRHVPITTGRHPVEIATARLDHALEQCDTLDQAIRDFLDTRPFAAIKDPDLNGGSVVRGRIFREPPQRIGFLAADAISTIRTALDNLFWAFAIHHSGPPDPARSRFPIYDDFWGDRRATWSVDGLITIRAVSYEVGEAIKNVQPCVRTRESPHDDLLWVLGRLGSNDVCAPLRTGAGVMLGSAEGATFRDGEVLPKVAYDGRDVLKPAVDPVLYVALLEDGPLNGTPLSELVRYIHDYVRGVVLPGFVGL